MPPEMTQAMMISRSEPKVAALVLCLATAACGILEPRLETTNLRPLVPLSYYVAWHAEVEACVGRSRDFSAIRWFEADLLFFDNRGVDGVWHRPDEITIRSDRLLYGRAVKYELIHYVTQSTAHNATFDECSTRRSP